MAPLIPEDDETREKKSVYMLESVWADIERIAEEETAERKRANPRAGIVSANKVIEHFLRWAIEDYRRQKAIDGEKKEEKPKRRG